MKRNPFLSLWLSGANALIGSARGQLAALSTRQRSAAMRATAKQIQDFWFGGSTSKSKGKRRTPR